jgi:hypothetical protein
MALRFHRPLDIIAFNANGIWILRYELSKRCKTYMKMWLGSQRHVSTTMEVLYSKLSFLSD